MATYRVGTWVRCILMRLSHKTARKILHVWMIYFPKTIKIPPPCECWRPNWCSRTPHEMTQQWERLISLQKIKKKSDNLFHTEYKLMSQPLNIQRPKKIDWQVRFTIRAFQEAAGRHLSFPAHHSCSIYGQHPSEYTTYFFTLKQTHIVRRNNPITDLNNTVSGLSIKQLSLNIMNIH